jgi:hypothetical protein
MAIRLEPRILRIDTWNDFVSGTEVCESLEHGRRELDATERFIRRFKEGEKPAPVKGKWSGAAKVLYTLTYDPHDQGLRPVEAEDGIFYTFKMAGSVTVMGTKKNARGPRRHLYFDVDDSFAFLEEKSFEVTVEYLDAGSGSFSLEYDSGDRKLHGAGQFTKSAGEQVFRGSGEWRTAKFTLPDAVFGNAQSGGADFRFAVEKRGLTIRGVQVTKK